MANQRERKPIDPHLHELLEEQAMAAPDLSQMAEGEQVEAVRAGLERALHLRDTLPGLPNAVERRDLRLDEGLHARLYTPPEISAHSPLLVYFHGGGWVAGSLATHDPFCCLLSAAATIRILSVSYRQPPEHPYPAALDDCVLAIRWAAEHAAAYGGDTTRLAVGGDSAGGNLAAAAVNRLVAEGKGPRIAAQMLLFPVTDHPGAHHPSYEENATGYGLTAERMHWFWQRYAPRGKPDDPALSPLRLDPLPADLPPTLVYTAEYDVLRDEGIAYAEKLRTAGVMTVHFHQPDMSHDFPVSPSTVARYPQSVTALNQIAGWLRATLHTPLPGLRHR